METTKSSNVNKTLVSKAAKRKAKKLGLIPRSVIRSMGFRMFEMISLAHNFLAGCGMTGMKTGEALKKLERTDPQRFAYSKKFLRSSAGEILGTYEPVITLNRISPAIIASSTGVLNPVVSLNNQDCAYYDEFEAIFDEVRAEGPCRVSFRSVITSTNHELATGVIDYNSGSALASIENALAFDTAIIFVLNPYNARGDPESKLCCATAVWNAHFQGLPDKEWAATSTTNTYGYWKAYAYAGVSGSTTYGYINYELSMRFRQIGTS